MNVSEFACGQLFAQSGPLDSTFCAPSLVEESIWSQTTEKSAKAQERRTLDSQCELISTDSGCDCVAQFKHKAIPVLDGPAVLVCPLVDIVVQELIRNYRSASVDTEAEMDIAENSRYPFPPLKLSAIALVILDSRRSSLLYLDTVESTLQGVSGRYHVVSDRTLNVFLAHLIRDVAWSTTQCIFDPGWRRATCSNERGVSACAATVEH